MWVARPVSNSATLQRPAETYPSEESVLVGTPIVARNGQNSLELGGHSPAGVADDEAPLGSGLPLGLKRAPAMRLRLPKRCKSLHFPVFKRPRPFDI